MLTTVMPEDLRARTADRAGDRLIGLEPPHREVITGPEANATGEFVVGLDDGSELPIPAGGEVAVDRDEPEA